MSTFSVSSSFVNGKVSVSYSQGHPQTLSSLPEGLLCLYWGIYRTHCIVCIFQKFAVQLEKMDFSIMEQWLGIVYPLSCFFYKAKTLSHFKSTFKQLCCTCVTVAICYTCLLLSFVYCCIVCSCWELLKNSSLNWRGLPLNHCHKYRQWIFACLWSREIDPKITNEFVCCSNNQVITV